MFVVPPCNDLMRISQTRDTCRRSLNDRNICAVAVATACDIMSWSARPHNNYLLPLYSGDALSN
jgi:hypothetical protein